MKMSFNITLRMLQRQRRHTTRFGTAVAEERGRGEDHLLQVLSAERQGV